MDNEVVAKVIETSIVAGAFLYLLRFTTMNIITSLQEISVNMKSFGESLNQVGGTLLKIDMRVEQLERRIEDFEKGVR